VTADASARHSTLLLCLAIVYLVWGGSYIATAIGVHSLPPFAFGGVRFTVGGLLLFAVARAMGPRTPVSAADWRHAALVAVGTVLLSNGCNVWGMQWVASNQAALLNTTSAFWIPLLGMFGARGHALSLRVALGLLVGFAGAVLIILPHPANVIAGAGSANSHSLLLPQIVILIGCMGWAGGTIYMRNFRSDMDLLSFTGLQLFCGGLMLLMLAFARNEFALWHWSWSGAAAMAYLLLLSSCVAYAAYSWLARHATPAQTGSYGLVNPAVATFFGWWILDERLSQPQIIGMVIILLGLLLVNWPQAQPRA
jgi:drug/metabolite transporter (DMT)-like permease